MLATLVYSTNNIRVTETVMVSLLLIASLVAIVVSRLRLPYTVALVLVGLAVGLTGGFSGVRLTRDLILLVFLPPLLFEGAVNMHIEELRRRRYQVAVLAVLGTLISAFFVAVPLVLVPGMPVHSAVLLAVMLAPTDPVSVLAVLKDTGITGGLRTLLEGESVFNDALGIVLYGIALEWALPKENSHLNLWHGLGQLGQEVAIGVAAGVLVGLVAHRLMSAMTDHLVEITLSVVTAYGAFLLADWLSGSGVIATATAGLLIGNYGKSRAMSDQSRASMLEFWEVIAFLTNSAIFLLIGLRFRSSDLIDGRTLVAVGIAIVGIFAGRAVIAFGLLQPFKTADRMASSSSIPKRWMPAIFWGGLRGSIPIALVLGLTDPNVGDVDALGVIFGVVVFSVVVQGVSYRPLVERLGLTTS